jgi:predicted enzyme related to lactoylglutathione lyase
MADNTMDQHALNSGSTFVWHELYTANVKSSIDFYTNVLGFETQEMTMEGMGTYTMLTKNGHGVAGMMDISVPDMAQVPPHWAVYLAVDDVDARCAKAVEAGAKVLVPAMDVPTVGRMSLIQDPNGATLWLFKSVPMD